MSLGLAILRLEAKLRRLKIKLTQVLCLEHQWKLVTDWGGSWECCSLCLKTRNFKKWSDQAQ